MKKLVSEVGHLQMHLICITHVFITIDEKLCLCTEFGLIALTVNYTVKNMIH